MMEQPSGNFNQDQGYVIRGGSVAPRCHAIEDLPFHPGQREIGGFANDLGEAINAQHLLPGIEILGQAIRVD